MKHRRRVGVWERLRNLGFLPLTACVLVFAVIIVIAFRMLDPSETWSQSLPPQEPIFGPTITLTERPEPDPTPEQPPPTRKPTTKRYEAEMAALQQASVASNHAGFSGTGFVDYANVRGSSIQWTVEVPQAGAVIVRLRYANGTDENRSMDLLVNGKVAAGGVTFGSTTSWTAWRVRSFSLTLIAGTYTIRAVATAQTGGPNVDYLELQQ